MFLSYDGNLVIAGCFHVAAGHAVVRIARVKATPRRLIKRTRGKEAGRGRERNVPLRHPAVAVGKIVSISVIKLY